MMKIDNVKVYDLEESIIASGLPMMAEYDEKWIMNEVLNLQECDNITDNPHFKRACKLAANPAGSGHNNFLSGILVAMNVTATNVWWMQMERYHFVQIVSSQSKMHRLYKMVDGGNIDKHCNPLTNFDGAVLDESMSLEELIYSCPMGLELTARITTNYLQLKTIYNQRKNHKLEEWREFCRTIEALPFAKEFIAK
jgi:hypothetical protein